MRALVVLLAVGWWGCKSQPTHAKRRDAAAVPITVVNKRSATIWVASQTECAQWPYRIEDRDGRRLLVDVQAIGCDHARQGNCPTFGGCPGPHAFKLEPGASIAFPWRGTQYVSRTLPEGEVGKGCPSSCVDDEDVEAGAYTLVAVGWSDCSNESECMAHRKPTDLKATATVKVPLAGPAELVFE